jgi:AraC family transcriptional regulator, transcriptional activator of pobA
MQAKTYYSGIYQQNSIDFEGGLINVSAFPFVGDQFIKVAKPHAHNFLQAFLMEQGTTVMNYEDQKIEITSPAFFTVPKNIEHGFASSNDCRGWIINLSDSFLENLLNKDIDIIMELDVIHIEHLEVGEETERIVQAMQKIVSEFNQNLPGKYIMLDSLVSILFVRLHRIPVRKTEFLLSKNADNSYKIYFRRFMQSVKLASSFKKSIVDYASELNISQGHLNRICNAILGKSPKDIINEYFIHITKIALCNVDKSIAQVAFDLSFDDPAYFSRLFKKQTGLTPKEFRLKQGIKSS